VVAVVDESVWNISGTRLSGENKNSEENMSHYLAATLSNTNPHELA